MNWVKLDSSLASLKPYLYLCILVFNISVILGSCGNSVKVEVSKWTPKKEVVFKKDGLNLVKEIVPLKDSNDFLIVSGRQICRLTNNKLNPVSKVINPSIYNLEILRDTNREPSYIIGSGLSGKPSAVVIHINGQLIWSKNYGLGRGRAVILDDGNERFVIINEKGKNLLFLNFETGEILRKGAPTRVLASADFTGDGHHEVLVGLAETEFAILDGKLNEKNKVSLSPDYWFEPVVTSAILPYVVFSAGDVLDVYDSKLNFVENFEAEGAADPMHVVAATYLGDGPNTPFAAIYKGQADWRRMSILYVFSSTGELVFKEILEGDYQSITSVSKSDRVEFLVGGRHEVLRYSF